MLHTDTQYSKLRWLFTIGGLFFYVVDIWTDVGLALKYFQEEHYVWAGLTLVFVVAGLLVTQIFSYAWCRDDFNDPMINPEGNTTILGKQRGELAALHLLGLGIFTRYYHLLKKGFVVVSRKTTHLDTLADRRVVHHRLFCHATDLSMLKLLEAFLESVPQLLLQVYIVLGHEESSYMQYVSMAFSFLNIAWALVDYRRCLRRSLPCVREMPSGLPTAIYLLYKFFTISSLILSYSLLLILSTYSTIALVILWLLGTTWSHLLRTNFCSSRSLEFLYRAVIGVILTFTFFNVKGQNTKVAMSVYYVFYSLINITAPVLLAFLKPESQTAPFFLPVSSVISGGSVLGLLFLLLYYRCLHPREELHQSDEVDGLGGKAETTKTIRCFLQP
ncbi:XK-related protein 9 [Aulostomus maculatus]